MSFWLDDGEMRKHHAFKIILGFLCGLFLVGCKSVQRTVVPGVGDGVAETREHIAELGDGQTELAVTGERIESQSAELAAGIEDLERAIDEGTGNDEEFEDILRTIRSRAIEEGE